MFHLYKLILSYQSTSNIFSFVCLFLISCVHQVPSTAAPPQTKTAQCWQAWRSTTPHSCLTWRPIRRSITLSLWTTDLTCKRCWEGSGKSRSSLKAPWCLEKARSPKELTQAWSRAAALSVGPNRTAAAADGTRGRISDWATLGFAPSLLKSYGDSSLDWRGFLLNYECFQWGNEFFSNWLD